RSGADHHQVRPAGHRPSTVPPGPGRGLARAPHGVIGIETRGGLYAGCRSPRRSSGSERARAGHPDGASDVTTLAFLHATDSAGLAATGLEGDGIPLVVRTLLLADRSWWRPLPAGDREGPPAVPRAEADRPEAPGLPNRRTVVFGSGGSPGALPGPVGRRDCSTSGALPLRGRAARAGKETGTGGPARRPRPGLSGRVAGARRSGARVGRLGRPPPWGRQLPAQPQMPVQRGERLVSGLLVPGPVGNGPTALAQRLGEAVIEAVGGLGDRVRAVNPRQKELGLGRHQDLPEAERFRSSRAAAMASVSLAR